nr:hypothetical protein [Corynebacterium freiburgense]
MRVAKRRRILPLIFLTIMVLATFGLAYWQWTRFQSGSGSFQNLGYALQWPAFGAFFVYAYRKILQYEAEVTETGISPVEREQNEARQQGIITEIDESILPQRPKMDVETFNRLNTPQRRRKHHTNEQ